jgi:peptide/nickel transport system substrate-binding protein
MRPLRIVIMNVLALMLAVQAAQAQTRLVYGLSIEPSGFDPHVNQSATMGVVIRQVYDTLIYRDPSTYEFVAGLATEWRVSDDGLVYTFRLREGITFHDGTPFNAQVVADNLDRISDPNTASQRALALLGPYTGYTLVDDTTIQMNLSAPHPSLLDSLAQVYLGMASPTRFKQHTDGTYQYYQVGTGPFEFVEYVPNDFILIRRNPNYWGGPAFYQAVGATTVNEVEFRFFADAPTRALALQSGQAQVMSELPPFDAAQLASDATVRLYPTTIAGQPLQFLFNTARFPTDNLAVRQAILQATNRTAIVDAILQGFGEVAWGPLSPNTLYYTPATSGVYPHNSDQARRMMAQSGFVDADADGYIDGDGMEGDLELRILAWGFNFVPEIAQAIQAQWRDVGIRATLDIVPTFSMLREAVAAGDYHLVSYYTPSLDPAILSNVFITDAPQNWLNYSNPQLDLLLTTAAQQIDPAGRAASYATAQAEIMNQALILPISNFTTITGAAVTVQGLQFDAYGWYPILHNVSVQP